MIPKPFTQWQHYKGAVYTVICIAQHSETRDRLVIYANAQGVIYARPLDMFQDTVPGMRGKLGLKIPRFSEVV